MNYYQIATGLIGGYVFFEYNIGAGEVAFIFAAGIFGLAAVHNLNDFDDDHN